MKLDLPQEVYLHTHNACCSIGLCCLDVIDYNLLISTIR